MLCLPLSVKFTEEELGERITIYGGGPEPNMICDLHVKGVVPYHTQKLLAEIMSLANTASTAFEERAEIRATLEMLKAHMGLDKKGG